MLKNLHHIPEKRRELFLKIWGGFMPFHEVTTRLFYLDAHFPEPMLDAALRWLINNDLTGASFVDFVKHACGGSNLELHRLLISKLEKNPLRPVFAGKDFVR